jgi:hypothetical protein
VSFTSLLIHTVTVYNIVPGSTDRYGNETQVFDAGTPTPARVQQLDVGGQAREELQGQDERSTYFKVFMPPTVTVSGLSQLVWGVKRMQVSGEPHLVYDGVDAHHYEVMAQEVLGG